MIGEGGQGDRDAEAGAGQPGVDAPHEERVGAQGEQGGDALEDDAVDEEPGVLRVAGDPIEDGVRAVLVEEAEAQVLKLGVKLLAEMGDDPALGQPGRDGAVRVGQARAGDGLDDDAEGQDGHDLEGRPVGRRHPAEGVGGRSAGGIERVADDVDDDAQELQPGQAEREDGGAQGQGEKEVAAEAPGEGEEPADEVPGGLVAGRRPVGRRGRGTHGGHSIARGRAEERVRLRIRSRTNGNILFSCDHP